jgi:hypothetical protein
MEMQAFGKMLLLAGLLIACSGALLMLYDKIPFLGKLPGDITIKKGNIQFFFPITTSIIVSIVISLIVWILSHCRGK